MTDGYGEIKYRAQHGAMVFEEFRDGRGEGRWRDGFSSYLDRILTEAGLFDAAQKIRIGWQIDNQGLGFVVSDPLKVPGGKGTSTAAEHLMINYSKWRDACKRRYLSPIMTLDVLVWGLTLNQCDEKHKFRHGTAKQNMLKCLELYGDFNA